MALYPDGASAPKSPTARFNIAQPPASARKVRSRALVFMGVALLAGVGAAWLITVYLSRRANQVVQVKVPTIKVAVAGGDLPIATVLGRENVEFIDWPQNSLPPGAISDFKNIEGRVTQTAVAKNVPLLEGQLAAKGAGMGLAAVIPTNMRAMTVKVNESSGVGGFIHPGDLVDVVVTMSAPVDGNPNGNGAQEFRSHVALQNIKVMAVGEDMVTMNSKPVKVPVVTLLVTPEQSERLALGASHGELALTLRSQLDRSVAPTLGVSPPELLGLAGAGSGKVTPAATATATVDTETILSRHRPSRGHKNAVEAQPAVQITNTADKPDIIEVLHGDKTEEKTVRKRDNQ